ncbi:glycosyltransferase family 2 protein [Flavihumibacter sp. R14]|nr:glycosyltransferase family 2 protein [Flavihumibacter soli]
MNPVVSVIYVNYNTSVLLLQSIRSLIDQTRQINFEVIIVDNASESLQKEILQKEIEGINDKNVRVIWSDKNLGFGKANNLAANDAIGKYLFFLNPDTIIITDVINIFSDFLNNAHPNTAACGGNLLKPDLSPNDSYGNFPGLRQELAMTGLGFRLLMKNYQRDIAVANAAPQGKSKVPYIVGADIFIRRESFDLVKGFDENYFLYYEETDLFRALEAYGLESFIVPEAKIIHFEGAALDQIPGKGFSVSKFRFLLNSKMYYHRKWQPQWKGYILKTIVLLQIIAQFLKGKMGRDLKPLIKAYYFAS